MCSRDMQIAGLASADTSGSGLGLLRGNIFRHHQVNSLGHGCKSEEISNSFNMLCLIFAYMIALSCTADSFTREGQ